MLPDEGLVRGTIRATEPEARSLLVAEVARVAESVADTHRLEADVRIRSGIPPAVNPRREAAWAPGAGTGLLGEEAAATLDRATMPGEDFAFYLQEVPGAFLPVGARDPEAGPRG